MSADPWDAVIEQSGGDVETWSLNMAERRAREMAGALKQAVEDQAAYATDAVHCIRAARVAYDQALLRSKVENEGFSVSMHEAWSRLEADEELFNKDLAEKMEQHYRKKVDAFQAILTVIMSVMKNSRALSGGQR